MCFAADEAWELARPECLVIFLLYLLDNWLIFVVVCWPIVTAVTDVFKLYELLSDLMGQHFTLSKLQ